MFIILDKMSTRVVLAPTLAGLLLTGPLEIFLVASEWNTTILIQESAFLYIIWKKMAAILSQPQRVDEKMHEDSH